MKRQVARILDALRGATLLTAWRLTRWVYRRRERAPVAIDFRGSTVRIERDAVGTPRIYGNDIAAVCFGQGYAMAIDRLWQMDVMRRQAQGRLSEIFGPSTLEADRFHRALRIGYFAARSLPKPGSPACLALSAFCDGINEAAKCMRSSALAMPVEFALLRQPFESWTPADSLAVLKLTSLQLSMNAKYKAVMSELLWLLPSDKASALASRPGAGDYITLTGATRLNDLPARALSTTGRTNLRPLLSMLGQSRCTGSNAWVVAGKHTATGMPLLGNDPHLPLGVPALLHQSHLCCTSSTSAWESEGVNVPGLPGLVAGHNGGIVWGITNSQVDVQDLVPIDSDPHVALQAFESTQGWESIGVRGQSPASIDVRTTPAGPALDALCGTPLAFAWSGLLPGRDIDCLLALPQARDWIEFRRALSSLDSLSLNFLFASRSGDIAFKTTGRVPRRLLGPKQMPAAQDWQGFLPFDELPELLNPASGFIVNGNNPITEESTSPPLTVLWNPSFRARRIHELLVGRDGLRMDDMHAVMQDDQNLHARDLLPGLLNLLQPMRSTLGARVDRALDLLESWDFCDRADAVAPLLWDRFFNALTHSIYRERVGSLLAYFDNRLLATTRLVEQALRNESSPWLTGRADLTTRAVDALCTVVEYLPRMRDWPTWGNSHRIGFCHPLSSAIGVLRRWTDLPTRPCGGSAVTVGLNAGSPVSEGPVWSMVAGFVPDGTVAETRLVPGQSGDFRSTWYGDQAAFIGIGAATRTYATSRIQRDEFVATVPRSRPALSIVTT